MLSQEIVPVYSSVSSITWSGASPGTGGVTPAIGNKEIVLSPFALAGVTGTKSARIRVARSQVEVRDFIAAKEGDHRVLTCF
jgi:hypothetical protein